MKRVGAFTIVATLWTLAALAQVPKHVERVPQEPKSRPITGEVPDELLAKVMEDLAERTDGARSEFREIRGESIQWPDGSLGCAQPGQEYTSAPVNGFWIVLEYQDKEYDYRASAKGYFVLCERGLHRSRHRNAKPRF